MSEKVTVFEPQRGKDMMTAYPELATIEEFAGLNHEELVWIWCWSNPTSPFSEMRRSGNTAIKIAKWIKDRLGIRTPEEVIKEYAAGTWTEIIIAAMRRMTKFKVRERSEAREIVDTVFDNMKSMIELSDKDVKSLEGNFEEKKKYVDLAATVTKTLPMLLKFKETGFGLSDINVHGTKLTKEEIGRGGGASEMDLIMRDVKENGEFNEDDLDLPQDIGGDEDPLF